MSTGVSSSTQIGRRFARAATLVVLLLGVLALATPADARLGGGGSFGSRGSRTFSMPSATPTAPRVSPIPGSPMATPYNGFGASRPGFFGGGFGRGLLGGFLGAGLFGLLFGQGFGGGLGGGSSFIGLLLQLGLLYLAFRFIMGFFRRQQPALGGAGTFGAAPFAGNTVGGGAPRAIPITIAPGDYQVFEQRLIESQAAYSKGDIGALRQIATSEMAANFSQELAGNARQGVVNQISNVQLLQGDLSEAWREGNADYASVAMRFALVDATVERASGRVVSGNASAPQQVTEMWTFTRPSGAPSSAWILSAIQQT